MKKRRVVLILLVLAAAGGGAWYWFDGRMNATNTIPVSGNLELTQVDLSFKTAGRMTELAVREGDFVKKGDLIAKLDSAQLEQQLLRDQAAVASAQSSLQQLQTSIEYQAATIDSDISDAPRRAGAGAGASWTSCWREAARKRSSRRNRRWRTPKPGTIRRSRIGNARKRCSRAKTFRSRSTIRLARNSTARRRSFGKRRITSGWCRRARARKKSRERAPRWPGHRRRCRPRKPIGSSCGANRRNSSARKVGNRPHARAGGHDADADRRFDDRRAHRRRGAGEVGGSGRSDRRRNHHRQPGRYRPSLAARLYQ